MAQNSGHFPIIRALLASHYTETLGEELLLAKVRQMSPEESTQFLAELQKFPSSARRKRDLASSIAKLIRY
jgi:hypothetical protein